VAKPDQCSLSETISEFEGQISNTEQQHSS